MCMTKSGEEYLTDNENSGLYHETWDTPKNQSFQFSTNSGLQVFFLEKEPYTQIPRADSYRSRNDL